MSSRFDAGPSYDRERILDWQAERSRYAHLERPVENPKATQAADGLLRGLTPTQREVAELHGMASLSFKQADELRGRSHGSSREVWNRVVYRLTGVATPRIERELAGRGDPWSGPVHGRNSTYTNYRCHCDPCTAAHREALARFREPRRQQRLAERELALEERRLLEKQRQEEAEQKRQQKVEAKAQLLARVEELRQQGWTQRAVMRELGVSKNFIYSNTSGNWFANRNP